MSVQQPPLGDVEETALRSLIRRAVVADSLMALSRSLTVFNARDACIQEQWSTHPCNGLFVDWTFVDVLLTFYGCVIPPYLFSRKVVRQHTTIAWQNFKYYFDRTSGSVGLQDK